MDTKKLRQKILDLAIRGKLVPQDPNDEPASVLLARIKAEKEQLIKEGKIKRSKQPATSDTFPYKNVPFEIPESWVWCKPSDVFIINPRNNTDDATDVGFVPMPSVMDGYHYQHGFETALWKNVKTGYTHFANGDFGLAKITPCFENRKSVIFSNLPNKIGAGTTELHILRPVKVNVQYMAYFYSSEEFITYGIKNFSGAVGQQRISKEIINDFGFALPPLNEQSRIVKAVEDWFAIIDKIEQEQIDLTCAIKQAKSKILDLAIHGKLVPQDPNDEPAIDLLRRINPNFKPCDNAHYPYSIPNSWCWTNGKDIYRPMKSALPQEGTFKYIDIDSIDNKRNIIISPKVIHSSVAPSRAIRYTEKGDVLFSMVRPYLRNIAMVQENDCIASSGFFVCGAPKCTIPQYCLYMMLSNYVVDGLNTYMKGDNSPSINKSHIDKYLFPLPPYAEQKRIVAKIEELFATLDRIKESLEA